MLLISRIILTVLTLAFGLAASPSFAADGASDEKDLFSSLRYPELHVSPSASDRLKMENARYSSYKWEHHRMIALAGLSTLIAGGTAVAKDETREKFQAAQFANYMIGGAWLVGSTWLSLFYDPYGKGVADVSTLPSGTKKQKIARERIAEEYIYTTSDFSRVLKWAAFFTNLAANVNLASPSKDGSVAFVAVGVIGSFLPILFKSRYEHIADQHRIYKKKIYGPVIGAGPVFSPNGSEATLGL